MKYLFYTVGILFLVFSAVLLLGAVAGNRGLVAELGSFVIMGIGIMSVGFGAVISKLQSLINLNQKD